MQNFPRYDIIDITFRVAFIAQIDLSMIYSYPVELFLIDKDTQRRADFDDIYKLKRDILINCMDIARRRKHKPDMIPYLQDHWKGTASCLVARIRRDYYDLLQMIDFDKAVYRELRGRALETREQYHLVQFDDNLLSFINGLRKPRQVSPPLFYDKGKIATAHIGKFYARFEEDCFKQETIIIRQQGQEKFFATCKQVPRSPPYYDRKPWIEPFLLRGQNDLPMALEGYEDQFDEMYEIMKGLIYFWFDFRF